MTFLPESRYVASMTSKEEAGLAQVYEKRRRKKKDHKPLHAHQCATYTEKFFQKSPLL